MCALLFSSCTDDLDPIDRPTKEDIEAQQKLSSSSSGDAASSDTQSESNEESSSSSEEKSSSSSEPSSSSSSFDECYNFIDLEYKYTWSQANTSCPENFHLPSSTEISDIYNSQCKDIFIAGLETGEYYWTKPTSGDDLTTYAQTFSKTQAIAGQLPKAESLKVRCIKDII